MPRGRQFYNPIIAAPDNGQPTETLERIELFPVTEDTRYELAKVGKWVGRRIDAEGRLAETAPGDMSHDGALAQAQALWPGLTVFELRSEFEDSTWTGHGPSPRMWQAANQHTDAVYFPPLSEMAALAGSSPETDAAAASLASHLPSEPPPVLGVSGAGDEHLTPAVALHLARLDQPGVYVLLSDVCELLESWAVSFEIDKNPSAAMALREAVDALKDVG